MDMHDCGTFGPDQIHDHIFAHVREELAAIVDQFGPVERLWPELSALGGSFAALAYAVGARRAGYSVSCALRIAAICVRIAERLGYPDPWVREPESGSGEAAHGKDHAA